MKKRNISFRLSYLSALLIILFTLGSCEEYLDQAPEATITEKDCFVNFTSFQGFIEVLYANLPDMMHDNRTHPFYFNFADETLFNDPFTFDQGNYWGSPHPWATNWNSIRIANMALANLDKLVDATQEQRDFIKGQALYFRALFHWDLIRNYGGMPYIDTVLSPTGKMDWKRLSYQESALKISDDFEAAAELLPLNWDATQTGQPTLGGNRLRANKVMALGLNGRNLLYAASPMMNEASGGNSEYNVELCKKAAEVFGRVLKICDETGRYKLQPWTTWSENFWKFGANGQYSAGGTEAICTNHSVQPYWRSPLGWIPAQITLQYSKVLVISANYVKNYGMANGLPIDDPASGYNTADPWSNRDPRFYQDIWKDGDEMANVSAAGIDRFAQLYTGGRHMGGVSGSTSGYYFTRWAPKSCNRHENGIFGTCINAPLLRLADIYLMYSEAVLHGYGSASSSDPVYGMTAERAFNIIRNRAQLPNISTAYTATREKFMSEIIRERAVEFSCEYSRWYDLRRWNLNADPKYLNKTAIDFDRGPGGKPLNLRERIVTTRNIGKKHNWLPIPISQTMMFKDFPQNPGW